MKKIVVISASCLAIASACAGMDLKQSKVTQVVNDVQIISGADQKESPAAVNDIFKMPDVLRTGAASRAELVAQDETVTRVGANTIFSFDPANRTIDLKQGSLLFHSAHGKGGGTIHTGSATASVLGTTLIVTTTPNGGFKVLALEGQVEVDFLNSLSQKLQPGQMTFILPGGNQLAPIVVFRLDDLVKNSLLVHGFNDPLSSMPLIQEQIEKQFKLITSGKATDTGYYVGNNADPDHVEVLDPNTIQFGSSGWDINLAFEKDAVINQSSLADSSIPTPPNHLFTTSPFLLSDNSYFNGQSFSGFAARNIYFNTSGSTLTFQSVDVSPYAGASEFDFVAAKNIDFEGSVSFDGFSSFNTLMLVGGQGITIAPYVTLIGNAGYFEIVTPSTLSLDTVSIFNQIGDINLTSGSDLTLQGFCSIGANDNLSLNSGGNLSMTGGRLDATTSLNLNAAGTLTLNNALINADPDSGSVTMTSGGNISISGTSIQAQYLTLNSGDGILLDGSGQLFTTSGTGATANLTAVNTITVNNADLSPFGSINMAANTINLSNVNLGDGAVILKSLYGALNVGSSVYGDVNFIENVTYKDDAAQNYVNNGGGITVTTLR